ncbi:MerR family transcriptional regulator [candidate division WOR-3 bacterium]|nr:MerR family transcriptional regulator [candidate division WOR-3 bacterium]
MKSGKFYLVTEVCRRLGIEPHILRYWEQEFEIKPIRNSAGRRIYNEAQLQRLQLIKRLVRVEKLTVAGARRQLSRMSAQPSHVAASPDHRQTLLWLRKELVSISGLLEPQRRT